MEKNWIREDINSLKKHAESGRTPAQLELAKRYLTGRDVSRDPKEAFSWVQCAAESGDPEALHVLGHCYATGTGIAASGRSAFNCFVKAALCDHAVSVYNLAICYEYGIGVDRDYRMAYALYEKAMSLGYAKATHVLVAKLWNRDVTDEKSARRDAVLAWYASQAKKGDELAAKNLVAVRRNRKAEREKELVL